MQPLDDYSLKWIISKYIHSYQNILYYCYVIRRDYVQEFQLLIRQDLPIYLIVAGLYDDIENLENAKHLTFFLRAEK